MHDDLFRPTVGRTPLFTRPPWRPDSIIYPAILGGALAAAVLGVLNGRRLALPTARLALIAGAGAAAFGARVAVTLAVGAGTGLGLIGALAGAAVWLVITAVQRRPFRAYEFTDRKPANLIGPGFAVAVPCGILESVIVFGLLG